MNADLAEPQLEAARGGLLDQRVANEARREPPPGRGVESKQDRGRGGGAQRPAVHCRSGRKARACGRLPRYPEIPMKKILLPLLLAIACPAAAQSYPSQPIRLIAPFPPGGSVDIMARLIAEPLGRELGGKLVIENRTGASGNIGMEATARAKPDGYTIVLNTIPLATNPALFEKLTWDPIKDFAPIGMVATGAHVLVVPNKVQARNVADLVRMAKASPGKLSYASAGVGTTFHLCGEMFKDSTGTFILHVPYRGGGPALVDTLGGQVDMSFPTLSAAVPHVKAGTLRALAVTSTTRSPQLPDVPTMQEAGIRDFQFTQWLALLAPAGTPRDVVMRLNEALRKTLGSTEIRDKFAQQSFDPFASSPEEAGKFIASEVQRFGRLIRSRKITAN
jgi:tripartite-type tricarboxylate transporter receptor subunit TctC